MNNKFFKTMFENLKDRFSKVAKRVRQVLAILSIVTTILVMCLYPMSLWFGVVFALVAVIAFVLTLMWRDIWVHTIYSCLAFSFSWWIIASSSQDFAFLLGSLAWCVLHYFMPVISKLITPKLEHDTHPNVSAFFFAFIFFVIGIIYINYQSDQKRNKLYEKEVFMPVTHWEVEVQNGNTVYVLFTKRGYIEVSPQDHPEVRFVNKNTKVRYLQDPRYANNYDSRMLEIKNN